jgi:type II secretory pathway pseudopilin PulG
VPGDQVSGFSLIEALVGMSLLATAVVMMAQLLGLSIRTNLSSRTTSFAAVLAQQKIEELRALTLGFDVDGRPLSDFTTDTSVAPETAGGVGLTPSPGRTLGENSPGYVDYIGLFGNKLGGGREPPAGAVYTRRWAIDPLPGRADEGVVIQVLVTANRSRGAAERGFVARLPGEARMVTLRVRKKS